jgi:hypothetical protein
MKITNSIKPKDQPLEAGPYSAYLVSVVSVGEQPSFEKDANGNPKKYQTKLVFNFEIPEEKDSLGRVRKLAMDLTASANEKATLVKVASDLNSDAVIPGKEVVVEKLLSRPVTIIVDVTEKGYNKIKGTSKIRPKDVERMDEMVSEPFIYDAWDKNQDTSLAAHLQRHIIMKMLEARDADRILAPDVLEDRLNQLEEEYRNSKRGEEEEEVEQPKAMSKKAAVKVEKPAPKKAEKVVDEEDEESFY